MEANPFIFSNEVRWRLRRHFAFWGIWWACQAVLYSYTPGMMPLPAWKRLEVSSVDAFFFLGPHIFLSYSLMYWVIPRFVVTGKYWRTALLVVTLFFLTAALSAAIGIYILDYTRRCLISRYYTPGARSDAMNFFASLMAGLRGSLTIGGLAAAIKLMKHWYVKQASNLELQRENIASQLQLLKAQVHPHFLFNTLNNVYSHAQVGSSSTPVLIAGLSDMLRYMLYECDTPLVPLEKELKMIRDYVLLERVRYGNKLDVNIQVVGEVRDAYIAPLLLLPFIENCFKHGASQMIDQPWISLNIVIEDGYMRLKLINGKAAGADGTGGGGIGVTNVRKRLDYMYPGEHQLVINNEEDVYIVNLKVPLKVRQAMAEMPARTMNPKAEQPYELV